MSLDCTHSGLIFTAKSAHDHICEHIDNALEIFNNLESFPLEAGSAHTDGTLVSTARDACEWIDTDLDLAMEHISAKYSDKAISLHRQAVDPCISVLPDQIHQLREVTRDKYSAMVREHEWKSSARRAMRRRKRRSRLNRSNSDGEDYTATLQECAAELERTEEEERQEAWTRVQVSMVCLLWLQDQEARGEDQVYDDDGNLLESSSTILTVADEQQELLERVLQAKQKGVWLDMACMRSESAMDRLVEYTGAAPRTEADYESIVSGSRFSVSDDEQVLMPTKRNEEEVPIDPRLQEGTIDTPHEDSSSDASSCLQRRPQSPIDEDMIKLSSDVGVA